MQTPRVIIAEPLAPSPQNWLSQHANIIRIEQPDAQRARAELLKELPNAHALIVRTYTIVDQELLDHAPHLRVIARAGVGLDNIDLTACKARNIPVVHTPSANTQAVVEYVTQMMLQALRTIEPLQSIATNDWHALRASAITPSTCVGSTLGIIGFGKIGTRLARVAKALGMQVLYHDLKEIPESSRHQCAQATLGEIARASDIISVHVDAREQNAHLLDATFFDQLNPRAILINTARGFVIDDHAAALYARANPNATLILDVHAPEPITSDSPYIGLPNVIRTPHIASATTQAKENMSWVVRDVLRVLNDQPPEHPAIEPIK